MFNELCLLLGETLAWPRGRYSTAFNTIAIPGKLIVSREVFLLLGRFVIVNT